MEALTFRRQVAASHGRLLHLARWTFVFVLALVTLLSAFLLVRRLVGGFDAPLPGSSLVLVGVIAAAAASMLRMCGAALFNCSSRPATLLTQLAIPTICVLCLLISLTMPTSSTTAVLGLWSILVVEEAFWWYRALRRSEVRIIAVNGTVATGATVMEPQAGHSPKSDDDSIGEAEEIPANVVQQFTRARDDHGVEVVSGVMRADFAPGEQVTILHVAFCPPLDYDPEVTAHQLCGATVTIQVRQAETFGARIELRMISRLPSHHSVVTYIEVRPRHAPGRSLQKSGRK